MDYKQKFIKSFMAASRRVKPPVKGLLKPTKWTPAHDDMLATLKDSLRNVSSPAARARLAGAAREFKTKRPINFS